jgi:hypothetical protein
MHTETSKPTPPGRHPFCGIVPTAGDSIVFVFEKRGVPHQSALKLELKVREHKPAREGLLCGHDKGAGSSVTATGKGDSSLKGDPSLPPSVTKSERPVRSAANILLSRCSLVWCGVVWFGVVWCGVVWCGAVVAPVGRCHHFALRPSAFDDKCSYFRV